MMTTPDVVTDANSPTGRARHGQRTPEMTTRTDLRLHPSDGRPPRPGNDTAKAAVCTQMASPTSSRGIDVTADL